MNIDTIWVHCSATKPSMYIGADTIREWHLIRGWSDIGYHYVITRSGFIEKGRDEDRPGAHVYGHNKNSLGICMVGGLNESGKPDANFTYAQYSSLVSLIAELKEKHGMNVKVRGHRDVAAKACPCFSIQNLLEYT